MNTPRALRSGCAAAVLLSMISIASADTPASPTGTPAPVNPPIVRSHGHPVVVPVPSTEQNASKTSPVPSPSTGK